MKWSENAWITIQPIYKRILELPFIQKLMDGTLEREKFIFYIQQDAFYLAEYGKVLMGIASKLNKSEHIEAFINFSGDSITVEKALHETFIKDISQDGMKGMSPSCLLYTSYLHKQLANTSFEVALAAVLPCFWIYKEVGDYILDNQIEGHNPYQNWIDTYGGEDFAQSVQQAIDICDEIAESFTAAQRNAMTDAFVMCTKMEWLFWDSAWRLEEWAI